MYIFQDYLFHTVIISTYIDINNASYIQIFICDRMVQLNLVRDV